MPLNLIPCVFKRIFGFDCPGCGAQRSLVALLMGNIKQSLHYYPPLLPILALSVYLVFYYFSKKQKMTPQKNILLYALMWIAISSIIINYFYKIYTGNL